MAVSGVASAEDDTVRAALERLQDEHRVHTAGAGNADDLDVRGVSESVGSGKVSARVGAPVAAESDYQRLESFHSLRSSAYRVNLRHDLCIRESR